MTESNEKSESKNGQAALSRLRTSLVKAELLAEQTIVTVLRSQTLIERTHTLVAFSGRTIQTTHERYRSRNRQDGHEPEGLSV